MSATFGRQGGPPAALQSPSRRARATTPPPPITVITVHRWNGSRSETRTCLFQQASFRWSHLPPSAPEQAQSLTNVYRIVLHGDDPRRALGEPYVVLDVNPAKTTVRLVTSRRLKVDGRMLCLLALFTHADLDIEIDAGAEFPQYRTFELGGGTQDVDFLEPGRRAKSRSLLRFAVEGALAPAPHPDYLMPHMTPFRPRHLNSDDGNNPTRRGPRLRVDDSDVYPHPQGGIFTKVTFRSLMTLQEGLPRGCKPLPTVSQGHASPPCLLFALEFSLVVSNRDSSGDRFPASVRTFSRESDDAIGRDEAPDAWKLIQRPAGTIHIGPLSADETRQGPAARWILHIEGVPTSVAVREWRRLLPAYHAGLRGVRGGSPVSFIPELPEVQPQGPPARWVMTYRLEDHHRENDNNATWSFIQNGVVPEPKESRLWLTPLSLVSAGGNPNDRRALAGALPQVRTTISGRPLEVSIPLSSIQPLQHELERFRGVVVRTRGAIVIRGDTGAASNTVRVGSLDLQFSPDLTPTDDVGHLLLRRAGDLRVSSADVVFRLNRVVAGGQDDPAGEEFVPQNATVVFGSLCAPRADTGPVTGTPDDPEEAALDASFRPIRPLLVPLAPSTRAASYLLRVEEAVEPRANQAVRLSILSQTGTAARETDDDACATAAERVLVLDHHPFLVAEVRYPPFERPATQASTAIAYWTNTSPLGSGWQLLFEEQPFCLILPPQAVGEEMIKDRTQDGTRAAGSSLGPSTQLVLDPRQARTRFSEAPWNLRRILGTPGQPKAGPLVKRLQYELLYGLTCESREPAIRLAEIFSRVGRIPARRQALMAWTATSAQRMAYAEERSTWARLYRRYLSRVAVLEPWNNVLIQDPNNTVILNEALTCRFRLPPASNARMPFDEAPDLTSVPGVTLDGALKGGAAWGFESRNVFQKTLVDARTKQLNVSDAAEVSDLYLSSLGGWGRQMAAFQNRLTKIYADVSMGRVSRYKIERLGRIGVFWNLAKHVIVYERAVTPSRQFAGGSPDDPQAPQRALPGWPAVRKVREYVEIIEDTRTYPDDTDLASLSDAERLKLRRSRGFVTHISFPPGAQFNVASAWGADVRDGWRMPLWHPGAHPADVYPKPRINLGVANGAERDMESTLAEIAEPQNLVFYTQTQTRAGQTPDSDPHRWEAVEGIDYVNAPEPRPDTTDFAGGDPRQYAANEPAAPPAYGPCTFVLQRPDQPVNVVAERAETALSAFLQTVTLARGEPATASWPASVAPIVNLEGQLTAASKQLLAQFPIDLPKDAKETVARLQQVMQSDPFATLRGTIADAKQRVAALSGALEKRLEDLEQELLQRTIARIEALSRDHLASFRAALAAAETAGEAPAQAARRIFDEWHRIVEELVLLIDSMPGATSRFIAQYAELAVNRVEWVTTQIDALDNALANGQLEVVQAAGRAEALLARARELERAIRTLGQQRPRPWLPDPSAAVAETLAAYIHNLAAEGEALVSGLRAAAAGDIAAARAAIARFKNTTAWRNLTDTGALVAFLTTNLNLSAGPTLALIRAQLRTLELDRDALLRQWRSDVDAAISAVVATPDLATLRAQADRLEAWVAAETGALRQAIRTIATNAANRLAAITAALIRQLTQSEQWLDEIAGKFQTAIGQGASALLEIRQAVEKARDEAAARVREYVNQTVRGVLEQAGDQTILQKGQQTLRLLRAFGEPPRVPKLDFERTQIGYYFHVFKPDLDLTPVTTAVNQATAVAAQGAAILDALKPLGVKLPTVRALDRLLPPDLGAFDLSRVFPNFGGLDLGGLFSGIKLPAGLNGDRVKVTHGVDAETQRAFVRADVDFHLTGASTLFAFGPFKLDVLEADFKATTLLEASRDGVKRKASGRLAGDWRLTISGTPLLLFHDTELSFDDGGGLNFSIDPAKVEFPGVMKFLTEAMSGLSSPGDGLSFGMLPDGFQSVLSLPIPDVQMGAFGISNLRFSAALSLRFSGDFLIGLKCGLARKDAPFALTIFILGGGGFIDVRSSYRPKTRALQCAVEIGITVSASLAIALGPIRGGVYVYFGITARYTESSGGLTLGVLFVIRGEVNILGIVSACVSLMLEATYNGATETLVGRGELRISIKICWCFTLDVHEQVTYTLAGSSSANAALQEPIAVLASRSLAVEPGADTTLALGGAPPTPTRLRYAGEYVRMLV